MAKKLAIEVQDQLRAEQSLSDFRVTQDAPLLLILDRRNDPITPLLIPWTYQAMVHEHMGIRDGEHRYGAPRPARADDMKQFPLNVKKHFTIIAHMSGAILRERLFDIGEVEQGLATNVGADFQCVRAIITNPLLKPQHKLRIIMLYALRYQRTQTSNIALLINLLLANGVTAEDVRLVDAILNIAGSEQRQDGLFSTESLLEKCQSRLKGLRASLYGCFKKPARKRWLKESYTPHIPHLSLTLEPLFRGNLKETSYPATWVEC
ncbi:hypothetical protein H0H92_013255 [Tricholoma furcatifolium]|nr:hypothetical protein H0H92_013255 [Tricholoma furcatifolium]